MQDIITQRQSIIQTLKNIYDPELPVNIWDLGLIYGVDLELQDNNWQVVIIMTFTSPNCPSCEEIIDDIKTDIRDHNQIDNCIVEIVWDPPWNRNNLDEEVLLELGMF